MAMRNNTRKQTYSMGIVCGRRPELLARTLESFQTNMFSNFKFEHVFANIDPFMGDENKGKICRDLLRQYFKNIVINEPVKPNFTAANRFIWSHATGDFFFTLEDDWVCLESIYPSQIEEAFASDRNVAEVSLMHAHKNWNSNKKNALYPTFKLKKTFLGIPYYWKTLPLFSTSPSFFRSDFVIGLAQRLMNTLDPEKQLKDPRNPELLKYIERYKSMYFISSAVNNEIRGGHNVIADIGREYRDQAGLKKIIKNGNSIWVQD